MVTVWHGPAADSSRTDQRKQTIVFRIFRPFVRSILTNNMILFAKPTPQNAGFLAAQWRNYRGSSNSRAVGPGRVKGGGGRPDQD